MLIILTTKWHTHTFSRWLEHFDLTIKGAIRLIPYEQLCGRMPAGNYLFTDLERISQNSVRFKQIIDFSQRVKDAGYKVINNPSKALMRYDLQKAILSTFHTYRQNEDYSNIKFPAFVRLEHDHKAVSDLIYNLDELEQVANNTVSPLICEFENTADVNKLFHKYSAFMLNGKVIPRHKIFSYHWIVKEPDIETDETLSEEVIYCQTNPHEKQIIEFFAKAHIDYGRIDYSEHNGEFKVWEINTNPNLNAVSKGGNLIRNALFDESSKALNDEFNALADITIQTPYIIAPFFVRGYIEKIISKL